MNWYLETIKDYEKKELMPAIVQENCPEETLDAFVAHYAELGKKLEERWADGRQYVAGNNITAADYVFLANYTMVRDNPGLKNPSLATKFNALDQGVHNQRILAKMREHCQASIDRIQPTMI